MSFSPRRPPEGRTPGTNQAIAELVAQQFRDAGVADVTIEDFSIPVSAAVNHSLHVSGVAEIAGDVAHTVNVFGGAGMVQATGMVDVGLARDVVPAAAGKVALFKFSMTRSLRTQYRTVIASGAVAAVIDAQIDTLRQRNVWTLAGAADIDGPIPIVTIEQAPADAIRAQLEQGANVSVDLATDSSVAPRMGHNVIARIPGTVYPDRVLVVNGHLDSWYAGAADDGQAVAALVVLAKRLSAEPLPFTVELIAFDCEETFLLGSNNYISRRLPDIKARLIGAISLETLAPRTLDLAVVTMDPRSIWEPVVQAGGLADLFPLTLTQADQMTAFDWEVPSDQGNFWQFGVPGFFLVTTYGEYHTALDDADNVDVERFGKILVALEATLRGIGALAPETFDPRPTGSIQVEPTITSRTSNRLRGTVKTVAADTAQPIDNASVMVTVLSEGYDDIVVAASAIPAGGGTYTFQINHNFGTASYMLSFDASVTNRASGRMLLRLQ